MSFDDWLLYFHVLGAVVWLGGGVMVGVLGIRARKTGQELTLLQQMEWVGPRVGGPAQLTMIVTGIWMVARSPAWNFGQAFVVTGIAVWVALGIIGGSVHPANFKAIRRAVDAGGEGSPLISALAARTWRATWIEVALLLFVVWAMVGKFGL